MKKVFSRTSDSWPQAEGDFMNQEEQLQYDLNGNDDDYSLETLEEYSDSCHISFDNLIAAVEAIPSYHDFDFCDPVVGPDGKCYLTICTNGDGKWAWVNGQWEQLNADGSIGDSVIKDSEDVMRQAEYAVQPEHVYDLYNNGKVEVNIPSGADGAAFGKACVEVIKDLWDDPDVNFHYPNCKFKTAVSGNKLTIETICDAKKATFEFPEEYKDIFTAEQRAAITEEYSKIYKIARKYRVEINCFHDFIVDLFDRFDGNEVVAGSYIYTKSGMSRFYEMCGELQSAGFELDVIHEPDKYSECEGEVYVQAIDFLDASEINFHNDFSED